MASTIAKIGAWLGQNNGYDNVTVAGFSYGVENDGTNEDKESAANTLEKINYISIRIMGEIRRLLITREIDIDYDRLSKFYQRFRYKYNPDKVFETLSTYDGTSYVINQGEELHMCVRGESMTALITVLVHELSHVGSLTPDHDTDFWENHEMMQEIVSRMGLFDESEVYGDVVHCGKITISQKELKSVASKGEYTTALYTSPSSFKKEEPLYSSPNRELISHPSYNFRSTQHGIVSGESLNQSIPASSYYTKRLV